MGWLSKATITFYEPNSGFGWFSETQSYLPNANINGYRTRKRSVRPFYQTEPQQGWLNKPVNLNLYEANSGFGWFSETQSYRPNENRNGYRTRQRAVRPFYQTEPQQGWIGKPNLTLYEARGGTAWFSQTQTWVTPKHPARDLDRWDQNDATFDVINFTAAFDPSLLNWQIPSARIPNHPARDLDRWDQDDANFDVVNFAQAFDPATQDWHIDTARTSQRLGRFLRETVPDNAWMGDHAQLNAWGIPADRMRLGLRYQRDTNTDVSWIFPTLPVFDPVNFNWTQQTEQTQGGKTYQRDTNPDTSWMFPNLPAAFDPAIQDWHIDSNTYQSRAWWSDRPLPDAWLVPSVVFDPALWPGTTIDSHRRWKKLTGRWQPDLDHAWITFNLPVVVPYDPTTGFAAVGIAGERTRPIPTLVVQRYQSLYDLGWLHDVIPLIDPVIIPPATINYQGDGKKKRKKRRNLTYELFAAMERTIWTELTGPVVVEAPARSAQVVAPVVDLSKGYDAALDQLLATAGEYEDLSRRVGVLRTEISAYQTRQRQAIEEDDEDTWLLM